MCILNDVKKNVEKSLSLQFLSSIFFLIFENNFLAVSWFPIKIDAESLSYVVRKGIRASFRLWVFIGGRDGGMPTSYFTFLEYVVLYFSIDMDLLGAHRIGEAEDDELNI